jgi:hypothetical protein
MYQQTRQINMQASLIEPFFFSGRGGGNLPPSPLAPALVDHANDI